MRSNYQSHGHDAGYGGELHDGYAGIPRAVSNNVSAGSRLVLDLTQDMFYTVDVNPVGNRVVQRSADYGALHTMVVKVSQRTGVRCGFVYPPKFSYHGNNVSKWPRPPLLAEWRSSSFQTRQINLVASVIHFLDARTKIMWRFGIRETTVRCSHTMLKPVLIFCYFLLIQ